MQTHTVRVFFKKGFTIIELLVVFAIMATILGITLPRLTRSSEATKLKTTTGSIRGLLETAKSYAATQHTYCAVVHDANNGKIYLTKKDIDDADNDSDTDEMMQFERGINIPTGITVYLTADDQVMFNPWSGVDNPDDAITINCPSINKQKTITVDPTTGYVQVS